MGSETRFEEKYLEQLVEIVASKFKNLKRKATLLALGGSQWRFGKLVGTKAGAPNFFYADNDQPSIQQADENGMMTTVCDPSQPDQIATIGKYEAIVMKNTLELIGPNIENLEDYFFALYKALKLNGTIVLITRMKPSLPMPPKVLEAWVNGMPTLERLDTEATECGFMFESTSLAYGVELEKEAWRQILQQRRLPHMKDVSDAEIDERLEGLPETIICNDEITIITLYKMIRVERPARPQPEGHE